MSVERRSDVATRRERTLPRTANIIQKQLAELQTDKVINVFIKKLKARTILINKSNATLVSILTELYGLVILHVIL